MGRAHKVWRTWCSVTGPTHRTERPSSSAPRSTTPALCSDAPDLYDVETLVVRSAQAYDRQLESTPGLRPGVECDCGFVIESNGDIASGEGPAYENPRSTATTTMSNSSRASVPCLASGRDDISVAPLGLICLTQQDS
ncbi:hypothetical protein AnigIFM49718_002571 [Aspergillus niger]|nr:hypothetical protein AnigIFM49718_002571 [Aspergillus niger]